MVFWAIVGGSVGLAAAALWRGVPESRRAARPWVVWAWVLVLPVLGLAGYALGGFWGLADAPLAARLDGAAASVGGRAALAQAQTRLRPDDASAWRDLALALEDVEASLEDASETARAWETAARRAGAAPTLAAAMWARAAWAHRRSRGGVADTLGDAMLARALVLNPDDPWARMLKAQSAR